MKKTILTTAIAFLLGMGMGQNAHADLKDGLVAHWSFDDCKATDNSGNGHDGTINGNPQCVDGVKGKAFSFDGKSDYVLVPNADGLNMTQQISFGAWVNLTDITGRADNDIILNKEGIPYELAIHDMVGSRDSIPAYNFSFYIQVGHEDHQSGWANGGKTVQKNTWTFLFVTYDGSQIKTYFDGNLVSTYNANRSIGTTSQPLLIGARGGSGEKSAFFNGLIDETRIYNRALTEAEVLELYNGVEKTKETVQISGQIKLGTQAGKGVSLSGDGLAESCLTDVTGKFNCTIEKGWTGFLTPELKGVTFLPPRISIADAKTDLIVKETIVGSKIEEPAFCELEAGSQADEYVKFMNPEDLKDLPYAKDSETPVTSMENMPIDYVFVLMLENRSFDSYFGRLPAYLQKKGRTNDIRTKPFVDESNPDGIDVPGTPYDLLSKTEQQMADSDFTPNANTRNNAPYNLNFTNPETADPSKHFYWKHHSLSKQAQNAAKLNQKGGGLCVSDTAHEWWAAHLQWNNGKMDGFYQSNHNFWEGTSPNVGKPIFLNGKLITEPLLLSGERAMLYYDERDIPFYYWLADNFAIGDRYFSSVLGPTWVNRDYLYAATSRGLTSNYSDTFYDSVYFGIVAGDQAANPAVQQFNGKPINYITESLEANGKNVMYWLNDLSTKEFKKGQIDVGNITPPKIGAFTGKAALSDAHVRSFGAGVYSMSYLPTTIVKDPPAGVKLKLTGNGLPSGNGILYKSYTATDSGFDAALTNETTSIKNGKKYADVAHVNFIDPKVLESVRGEDEHPSGIPQNGQKLAYRVVKSLMSHPEIWKRSVLFITYDEHGGFYDHVSPPKACKPDNVEPKWSGRYGGSANALPQACLDANGKPTKKCSYLPDDTDKKYGGDFDRYGVRVPVMVVSPWVKPNYVSHRTYDHTSILRFIEGRFGLPALTKRDANADPMLDMFDFSAINSNLAKLPLPPNNELLVRDSTNGRTTILTEAHPAKSSVWVPRICETWFKPDATPNALGSYDLAEKIYPSRDWSDGIAPPSSYDVNK